MLREKVRLHSNTAVRIDLMLFYSVCCLNLLFVHLQGHLGVSWQEGSRATEEEAA